MPLDICNRMLSYTVTYLRKQFADRWSAVPGGRNYPSKQFPIANKRWLQLSNHVNYLHLSNLPRPSGSWERGTGRTGHRRRVAESCRHRKLSGLHWNILGSVERVPESTAITRHCCWRRRRQKHKRTRLSRWTACWRLTWRPSPTCLPIVLCVRVCACRLYHKAHPRALCKYPYFLKKDFWPIFGRKESF